MRTLDDVVEIKNLGSITQYNLFYWLEYADKYKDFEVDDEYIISELEHQNCEIIIFKCFILFRYLGKVVKVKVKNVLTYINKIKKELK